MTQYFTDIGVIMGIPRRQAPSVVQRVMAVNIKDLPMVRHQTDIRSLKSTLASRGYPPMVIRKSKPKLESAGYFLGLRLSERSSNGYKKNY